MHVMLTANSAWNIWNFRKNLVEGLLADGHRVTIVAPSDTASKRLEELGCFFVPLLMDNKGLNPLRDLLLLADFFRMLKKIKPEVVLSFTIKNNIFCALSAKVLSIPIIPNVTGLGTAFLSGNILRIIAEFLYNISFFRLPVVFFQNTDDQELFLQRQLLLANSARLLPGSGIDLVKFFPVDLPDQNMPQTFLMIARLLRDKGIFEYIDAAERVRAIYPNVKFQLVGEVGADNRTAVDAQQVQQWVESGVVEYFGVVDDVRPLIANASCVVLPSYREGAPRTLMEAAAMARPIVTTDVPGCRSIVDRDENGFLCEARNAAGLACEMKRFLELPYAQKVAMGAAGRAKMERQFDQNAVLREYRKAIEDVVARRSSIN